MSGPYQPSHFAAATAAVTNRFVTSANMKVGAYTVANAAAADGKARHVTVTHTVVAGADTLGTITVTGTDVFGRVISESITPLSGTIATGLLLFATVTSVAGVGWVATSTADTIVVGHDAAAIVAVGGGTLLSVVVNTTAAGAVTIADATGTIAILKASIAEGTYVYGVAWLGYLSVTVAAASDVTIVHTRGVPSLYAMS